MTNITFGDYTLDSRDVEERIEELELMCEEWDDYNNGDNTIEEVPEPYGREEVEELKLWCQLRDELSPYAPDWSHGEIIIHDSYFEEYMDEMVNDCYDLPDLPSFMSITLDYDALRMDYTEATIDGETYLIR